MAYRSVRAVVRRVRTSVIVGYKIPPDMEVLMRNLEKWKPRILRAAREAKRAAVAAGKHADALLRVAREKAQTAARRRRVRKTLQQAGQVLKAAGEAALAAGAAAATAAVMHE